MSIFRNNLERAENLVEAIAEWSLTVMMFIVAADVIARYVFRAPLPWAHESTTLYLLPAVFFFGLPTSFRGSAHIAVDILFRNMPPALQWASRLISDVAILLFFGALFYFTLLRTIEAYTRGEASIGWIAWPVWVSNALVPIASLLVLLRMLIYFAHHLRGVPDGGRPGDEQAIGVE